MGNNVKKMGYNVYVQVAESFGSRVAESVLRGWGGGSLREKGMKDGVGRGGVGRGGN